MVTADFVMTPDVIFKANNAVGGGAYASTDEGKTVARAAFNPDVPKDELFARGYIAGRSNHSQGTASYSLMKARALFGFMGITSWCCVES